MTLAAMQAELTKIETALSAQAVNGSAHTLFNGHQITEVDVDRLQNRANLLKRRIFRYLGYDSTRTAPAFNTGPLGVPYYY